MVLPNEATKILINEFPNIKKTEDWKSYYLVVNPDEDPSNIHALMTVLTDYAINVLNETKKTGDSKKEEKKLFGLIENFIKEGDFNVRDAASTCFLENLINRASWGDLSPNQFIPYLGSKSKAYCKAWDEFTGVKTPGLWDE